MAVDPQQNLDANQPGEQLNLLDLGDMVPPRQRRQLLSPDFVPDPIVEQPFAEPPFEEFQVAGGGKGSFLVNLFKIFGAQRRIPRVPTLIEESRPPPTSPEGKPLTYIQQRDQAQEQALSPEGLERVRTERAARLAKQEEALSDPEGVMATARQAFSYEQGALGGNVAPRVVSEESAEELADIIDSPQERADALLKQKDFNLNQIRGGDDIKAMIAVMGERLKDPVEQAKRGVQSQELTKELAEKLLMDETGFTKRF